MNTATTPTFVGRTLAGRFSITGFLGEGAMASVYRGVQQDEPREVAIKVMHPELTRDETFVKRFQREAKTAARLKHPNTVQILDFGVDDDVFYIAMELLYGKDLFDILATERRLSEVRAVRMGIQICDALSAAHEKGIVHRDLKPENIMLAVDPENPDVESVKVLDFGIAKLVERDKKDASEEAASSGAPSSVLTTVGVMVGTPEYMSPEQCRADLVDARSDVYALGVLLYQAVTGRLPFTGDSVVEIALKHLRDQPRKPSEFLPTINPELEKVILTALNKWPAQRQQTALEVKAQLEKVLDQLPGGTPTPSFDKRKKRTASGSHPKANVPAPFRFGAKAADEDDGGEGASTKRSRGFLPGQLDIEPATLKNEGTPQREEIVIKAGQSSTPPPPLPALVPTSTLASAAAIDPKTTLASGVSPSAPSPEPSDRTNTPRSPTAAPILPVASGPQSAEAVTGKSKAGEGASPKRNVPVVATGKKGHRKKDRLFNNVWVLVPVAILVGVGAGILVFFLTQ
jgi:serine/threonine-protein kinase